MILRNYGKSILSQRKQVATLLVAIGLITSRSFPTRCSADEGLIVESTILKTIESTSVPAEVAGAISSLAIKEGSEVKAGAEIGRIKDLGIRLQAERAKMGVELAKKKNANTIDFRISERNVALARNEHTRAMTSNARVSGTYPISEMDRLTFLLERSVLETERANYQQDVTRSELAIVEVEYKQSVELWQRHRIVAPCDGMVISVEKRVGEWVEPGGVVLKIVQTNRLKIEGLVSAKQASSLKIGRTASVEPEGENGKKSEAKLVFISPEVNPIDSKVKIHLEVDNSEQEWRPGLRPKVVFK